MAYSELFGVYDLKMFKQAANHKKVETVFDRNSVESKSFDDCVDTKTN